jgi:hypothetical protein
MKKFIIIICGIGLLTLIGEQHASRSIVKIKLPHHRTVTHKKTTKKHERSHTNGKKKTIATTATHPPIQCPLPYSYNINNANNKVIMAIKSLSINNNLLQPDPFLSSDYHHISIKNLDFVIKKEHPKPFNDNWAKINTVSKLHQAGDKDGKLDYVLKISERMHLPPSVAVVPIVESNYRIHLVSNKGAAGAWQLMPQTARDYGIKVEERFQLAASTNAALHLLKDLHDQFGNWELAYAAYNAGGNRVLHAIKKNPKALTIEELDLPRETKQYVSRLKKLNQLITKFANVRSDLSRLIADF